MPRPVLSVANREYWTGGLSRKARSDYYWATRPFRRSSSIGGVSFVRGPATCFQAMGSSVWSEGRIAELERKIGQQALELDVLKGCLQCIEEQRMLQAVTGNPRSTGRS